MSGFGNRALRQLSKLPYMRGLWSKFPVGGVRRRVDYGIFPYPHYAYGVYWSALLASRLGLSRISVAEFGVAGGRGLLALEEISALVEKEFGVTIDVYGFDLGEGMPEAADYRDLPHIWEKGFYKMDVAALKVRLKRAKLIIGNVKNTVPDWLSQRPAPLAFVAFDLDYYSSTSQALKILLGDAQSHLPRVHTYFDDVAAYDLACMNEYVGELLAIREFNEFSPHRKVARIEGIRLNRPAYEFWHDRMFAFHDFSHPDYTKLVIREEGTQLPM